MAMLKGVTSTEAPHIVCAGTQIIMEPAYTQKRDMARRNTSGNSGTGIVVQPQEITMPAPRVIPPRILPPPPRVTPSSAPGVHVSPSSAPHPAPRPSSSSEPPEKKSRLGEIFDELYEDITTVVKELYEDITIVDDGVTDCKDEVADDEGADGATCADDGGDLFRVPDDEDREMIEKSLKATDYEAVESLLCELRGLHEAEATGMALTGVKKEDEIDITIEDQWLWRTTQVDSSMNQDGWSAEAIDGDIDDVCTPNPNE
jgi:hypothetical protein